VKIFDSFELGDARLKNRLVMAPMTRCRAENNIPNALIAVYYEQRSGCGLIISEGTAPSADGLGYARMPGLFNDQQQLEWSRVCSAVHKRGGRIFLQIMHTGRIATFKNLQPGSRILAPSAVVAPGSVFSDSHGLVSHDAPEEMTTADIRRVIADYASCAERAINAGFDGVEIHAASGYLPNQFLSDNANLRTDQYGGNPENKIRFISEILEAVIAVTGPFRTGIKISPGMLYNDIIIQDNISVYRKLISRLQDFSLAYLHVMRTKENDGGGVISSCRKWYKGTLMMGGGFDRDEAEDCLKNSMADLIAVGTAFIANPDLAFRWKHALSLAAADRKKFYTAGPEGYIDYPNYSST
jgi:2,4-dienoyl-CoA reductase-like NADH-dependent reductase (Old Yellow Enzyme family)